MKRLNLPLLPITLSLSLGAHAAVFLYFWLFPFQTKMPEPLQAHLGVASIKVTSSDLSPTKKIDVPPDIPILDEINPPPLPEIKPVLFKEQPLERPQERIDPLQLASVKTVTTPLDVPNLADDFSPPVPNRPMIMPHDPLKPVAINRPKEQVDLPEIELPTLKPVVTAAELVAKQSRASQESEGVVEELPRASFNPPAPYPGEAQRLRQSGTVYILLKIDVQGRVAEASIDESSGFPLLDDAALTTLRRWVFSPARRNGRAVSITAVQPYRFKLN